MSNAVPERSFMEGAEITWRHGKPDYSNVNKKYLAERSKQHKNGSLEKIVENLVKTWEMESGHKLKAEDWQTVDHKVFNISANGGQKFSLQDNLRLGNYNMFLDGTPLYNAKEETFDSSHELFKGVFKSGYPWEVLEVFSGPPVASFTWRHWGHFEGDYKDAQATGELIEMVGSCVVRLNDDLKIQSIEVYYDPNGTMMRLTKGMKSKCPFQNLN